MTAVMNPARPTFAMKPIGMLTGYQNGRLDAAVLADMGTRHLLANICSARKFKALAAAAVLEGIPLSSTGVYRSFDAQVSLMLQRFDRGYFPGRKQYDTYQGVIYSLKVGEAGAATPGTSNHGMGRSNDFAVQLNGNIASLRHSDCVWLATNAPTYGIYFEVPAEDWHGTDYAGDDIPQAVLDYEGGVVPTPGPGPTPTPGPVVPVFNPAAGQFSLYPFDTGKAVLSYVAPPNSMHSDLVSYLQGVLRVKLGYACTIDGWFGTGTRDFVTWFQATHGLTADGLCGSKTWALVDSLAG
jgi:peptidoglycan hydrolase-like protein with peptidoglycan-binding domain